MQHGLSGRILRADLSTGRLWNEEPEEDFYRRYFGGRCVIAYFLLREVPAGIDAFDPENRLVFAAGPVTGAPVAGAGRNSVGAKSPLTGGFGEAEGGGFFGAELKRAGFDAIVIQGRAERPVYLWLHDGEAEIRDASALWGMDTGESQAAIRQELGDDRVRTAQIGPAGERLVRYACVINDLKHAAGRTGLGAVMGSKNLKAVAVRGTLPFSMAEPERVQARAKWLAENVMNKARGLYDLGTASGLLYLNRSGGLPTRNFQQGTFEGADRISGEAMRDSILVDRGNCFACPVRCKRVVSLGEPFNVEPRYGGPEYETLASLGSNCGIDDLKAVAKANELCNRYGLDTISTGTTIAFAMECFEKGLLSERDTDGVALRFGNAEAMLQAVETTARREGFGDVLAEGVLRAASRIGGAASGLAMHVKGQELPMHEPRFKQGMGMGYAVSPVGADHLQSIHDDGYRKPGPGLDEAKALGILDPLASDDLSSSKVRLFTYRQYWESLRNCLVMCMFVPFDYDDTVELVRGVTGWNSTLWELLKVGERGATMARVFNVREGLGAEDDRLPDRFGQPFESGPLQGVAVDRNKMATAIADYYGMMGWDERGVPRPEKLRELSLDWAIDQLKR